MNIFWLYKVLYRLCLASLSNNLVPAQNFFCAQITLLSRLAGQSLYCTLYPSKCALLYYSQQLTTPQAFKRPAEVSAWIAKSEPVAKRFIQHHGQQRPFGNRGAAHHSGVRGQPADRGYPRRGRGHYRDHYSSDGSGSGSGSAVHGGGRGSGYKGSGRRMGGGSGYRRGGGSRSGY